MAEQKRMTNEELAGEVLDLLESRISAKYILNEEGENDPVPQPPMNRGILSRVFGGGERENSREDSAELSKDQKEITKKYSERLKKINKYAEVLSKVLGSSGATLKEAAGKISKDSVEYRKQFDYVKNLGDLKKLIKNQGIQNIIVAGTMMANVVQSIGEEIKSYEDIVNAIKGAPGEQPLKDIFQSETGETKDQLNKIESIIKDAFAESRKVYPVLTKDQLEDIPKLAQLPGTTTTFIEALKNISIDAAKAEADFMNLSARTVRIFYISSSGSQEKSKNSEAQREQEIEKLKKFFEDNKKDVAKINSFRTKLLVKNTQSYGKTDWAKVEIVTTEFEKFLEPFMKSIKAKSQFPNLLKDSLEIIEQVS